MNDDSDDDDDSAADINGVASYSALGHVSPLPPSTSVYSVLLHFGSVQNMTVISCVKYLQHLRITFIKISSFFILLKK